MASIQNKYRTSLRYAVILPTNCPARPGSGHLPLNWCDGTAHLMASLTPVCSELRRRCPPLSTDRDDGCGCAVAAAERSGAHVDLSSGRCAHLGIETIGGSRGGKGMTLWSGMPRRVDSRHPTTGRNGRSAQTAAIRRRLGEPVKATHSCPSRQALRRGGGARERTLAEDVGCREARRFVFASSGRSSPTFSVSAAPPPKSVASFTIPPTGSPATSTRCDLRHSADLKNVPHPINAPNLSKKRRLEECA